MAHLLTILGIFSLFSSCLAANCSYENMLIRMKNCVTMQLTATTVTGLKRQINAFCTDIDDHIRCQETALGNDCDGHFSKVGNRVGTDILCANVHDSVEALYNCRPITPSCGSRYANAIQEAASTYIKTGDISQIRADICRAFDLLKNDCFPVRSNSKCPPDYAAFAEDLLEVTVAAPVCSNRNMSEFYLKYGFTAAGEPIPGHSHKMIRYITSSSSFVSLSNVLTLTVFVIGFRSLNIATF